jgi:hypothetical protein
MSSLRRVVLSALSATAVVGAVTAGAVPASAAITPAAVGSIVCSAPYVCVQTQSVNVLACTAVVATWADTSSFYGRFEMIEKTSVGNIDHYSATKTWPAGGANYKVTVGIDEDQDAQFEAVAQRDSSGKYTNIGSKNFGINYECD